MILNCEIPIVSRLFPHSYILRFLNTGAASGPGLDMLLNMFGGLGMGGLSSPTTPDGPHQL